MAYSYCFPLPRQLIFAKTENYMENWGQRYNNTLAKVKTNFLSCEILSVNENAILLS